MIRPRNNMQRNLHSLANLEIKVSSKNSHKRNRNLYRNPLFWLDEKNQFWKRYPSLTPETQIRMDEFLEEQRKLANRKFKENEIQ